MSCPWRNAGDGCRPPRWVGCPSSTKANLLSCRSTTPWIVFRTAPGSKLTAADNELPVAFEVDGFDEDRRTGWSVVIGGKATTVEEPAQLARLDMLGVSPWAGLAERTHWVRIRPYSMTGREIIYPTS